MKRPTSFDVAAIAGVSQTTVSRALNQSPMVSKASRQRIIEIARQLNYKVDVNARTLRSKKAHTLAVLISDDLENEECPINPFFLPLVASIIRYANQKGYDVITSLQERSEEWGTDYGFSGRANGVIFLGCKDYDAYTHKFEYLNGIENPWVIWGVNRPDCAALCIGSDNEGGAYDAVSHLIGLGRRRIAFFGKSSVLHPEFMERYDGYRRALRNAGLVFDPALHADVFLQREEGAEAVEQLLARNIHFDAVFAATDMLAMGVIHQLARRGIDVPRDVSVMGFDDLWVCSSLSPSLSTVRQDTVAAAKALVDGLDSLISGGTPASRRIPTRLVLRNSCGGLASVLSA